MGILTVATKEVESYFSSPIIYAIFTVFFGVTGFLFVGAMEYFAIQSFQMMGFGGTLNITRYVFSSHFHNMAIVFLFIIPALTMRAFAEERKQNTIELLYTSPITTSELLFGKFFGILVVVMIMLSFSLYTVFFGEYLSTLDWGRIATSYLGLFLIVTSFISIGLFSSSLTENQVVAAISAFGISLIIWLLEWIGSNIGGKAGSVIYYLSLFPHFRNFLEGIVDTRDISYYISLIVFFLSLTWVSLELERW